MMNKKDTIEREICDAEKQINEFNKKIKELHNKIALLKEELKEIITEETTFNMLHNICITKNNSTYKILKKSTRTTPIMDEFSSSDKKYLIFNHTFFLTKNSKHVSLIVTKFDKNIHYNSNKGLTMTNLKTAISEIKYISKRTLEITSPNEREYPLYQELVKIDQSKISSGQIIPFNTPVLLGGQTFSDQTGFGSEYCGDQIVWQGKEYGETTKFLIIAVIIE